MRGIHLALAVLVAAAALASDLALGQDGPPMRGQLLTWRSRRPSKKMLAPTIC